MKLWVKGIRIYKGIDKVYHFASKIYSKNIDNPSNTKMKQKAKVIKVFT